ncbi:MAG: LacI family transcriptional regulator [Acidobacteria bacterium]|nr:LacI family transcriptional regulator [Acidobacteriota bacterium]
MSIRDVAREAGVSTATVSHVLNNSRFVSEETRGRVLRAVERCNYYPNAHARSLASGRSQMLGLLISDITNPFFPELVKAIEAAAFERGYDVVLSNTNYEQGRAAHYVRRMIERKVAGVALMTSEFDERLIGELASRHVSVVLLDRDAPAVGMSNLCVDYETGIEEAVRHLVALGHRRISFLSGPRHLNSIRKRLDAFRLSVARYLPGAPEPDIYSGDLRLDGGRGAAREMLGADERPTAVVAANDLMALGAMREFLSAGLSIPRDVSVVGFDDIAFASLAEPQLTTVCLPRDELGRLAVEALVTTVEHPERRGVELRISTYLVGRGSTGPAPAAGVKSQG